MPSTATTIAIYAELGRHFRSNHIHFAEPTPITDAAVLGDLQSILEPETGRIDNLTQVTLNGETFTGLAQQRISLGRFQTLRFTLSPDEMSYRLIDAEEVAAFAQTDEGWSAVTEFAAIAKSGRASKKLNCKPGNVQCGGKCQSGKKNCRVNPSPDQQTAVKAAAKKAKTTSKGKPKDAAADRPTKDAASSPANAKGKDADTPKSFADRADAKARYQLLGEGIEGEVYLSDDRPPRAIKYTNAALNNDALANVRLAGELGIAPKLYDVSPRQRAFSMEFLDGYEVGVNPSNLDLDADVTPYNRSFLRTLKRAHDNDIAVGDLHEDNVMVNASTQDIKFIDQGYLRRGSAEAIAGQLLDRFSSRPLAAEIVGSLAQGAPARARRELQRLQREWENRDTKPLTESDYRRMTSRVYELLEVD